MAILNNYIENIWDFLRDIRDLLKGSPVNSASSADAFGRIRVSDTNQRLDVEFLFDKQTDYFDEVTNNGAVTFNPSSRDLTLSLNDANDGSEATMASYPVPYTPGNSQLIDITGTLDNSGIGGGTAEFFLRSNVTGSITEEIVTQDQWVNNSTGVDWATSHIFSIDFQSLRVGRIQYGLVIDGVPSSVGSIENDNIRATGYWQLANLPVAWSIYNTTTETIAEARYGDDNNAVGVRYRMPVNASATVRAICCTVKSEGGGDLRNMPGLARAISTSSAVTVSTGIIPIISIRCKSTFNSLDNLLLAIPKNYSIITDNPIDIFIYKDATLTGASWVDVNTTDSMIEYDVSATAVSGDIIDEDFVNTSRNRETGAVGLLGKSVLWNRKSTETGVFTIAARRNGGQDASVKAAIKWEEIR